MRPVDRVNASRVACLVAVMLIAASPALGAKPRRHKPPRSPPAAARPPAHPEPEPADDRASDRAGDSTAVDSAPAAPPEPEAPVRQEPTRAHALPPAQPTDGLEPEPARPKRAPSSAPAPADLTLSIDEPDEDGVPARREAARIAAGRIEVAVSAGIDAGRRHFTYSDPIGAQPRPYLLKLAPMMTFGLEAYPLASTGLPFLQDLGFRGRVSRAFAVDSSTTDGVTIQTSWTRFGGEVRERVLLRGRHPIELGIAAGIDASYFAMVAKGTVAALVPSARTLALRFGVDARFDLTRRFSLLAGGAYLSTTTRGEIYDRFRGPRVAGVDADVGGALVLSPGLEARLTGRYTRYFAAFKPEVGDVAVAGGALDEQIQVGVGLRYAH